ncbi:mediator complex, subunit Med1 [Purpureocillium lavendulum]|uniref:Mediator of RNA polymerase II transcription subunit 1 n=1 Tax=Purpureocillium lavendulum TaxID=1247861 RepID=A0AB34FVN7_9HYPO|nr:mediator complex, subunit Med1 [Purpureocillium lavendulum]
MVSAGTARRHLPPPAMSTPTPMKHAPSQQGRTPSQWAAATPPVSTPFSNPAHAAFSPRGPKSSPQQVKKSPATSALMAQPPMGAFNFDSPSTAAAMGALGINAAFDIGLDNGVVNGLEVMGAALATEDDKLKRLDTILKTLSQKKGLVSAAGLERLAQEIGLELLSEEQTTADGRKTRTLAIAGSAIAVDIVLDNNIVQSVSLSYHGSAPAVSRHMDDAAQILLRDLQLLPGQSPLTKTLESFASNFARLATLDKLSIVPGLDCHEALSGIYVSLEKLYDWDLSKLREEADMKGKSDSFLMSMAMCARHGRPVMHARGKVGLAVQYWKQLRFAPSGSDAKSAFADEKDKIWSLLLGCAPIQGVGLPPVRVSENWISKDIAKDEPSLDPSRPILDWQDPDNISLPQSEENKDAGMEMLHPDLSTTRVPRVMFTATFDPPVVLPQNDWARLYMSANLEPPNIELSSRGTPPTFDSLLFPIPAGVKVDPSEVRTMSRRREVPVYGQDGAASTRTHRNTLYIYKPIYSQVVSEMPFSHPRQLIEMLPLLRQYAFLATLLDNSFGAKTKDVSAPTKELASQEVDEAGTEKSNTTTAQKQIADFLATRETAAAEADKEADEVSVSDARLDVILWVHPSPHLQVVFPMDNSTADITLKVREGGMVEIVEDNVTSAGSDATAKGKGKELTRETLGKALEYLEDLCKWAEWPQSQLQPVGLGETLRRAASIRVAPLRTSIVRARSTSRAALDEAANVLRRPVRRAGMAARRRRGKDIEADEAAGEEAEAEADEAAEAAASRVTKDMISWPLETPGRDATDAASSRRHDSTAASRRGRSGRGCSPGQPRTLLKQHTRGGAQSMLRAKAMEGEDIQGLASSSSPCQSARMVKVQNPRRKPVPISTDARLPRRHPSAARSCGAAAAVAWRDGGGAGGGGGNGEGGDAVSPRPDSTTLPLSASAYRRAFPTRASSLDPRRFYSLFQQPQPPPRQQQDGASPAGEGSAAAAGSQMHYWLSVEDVLAGLPGRHHLPPGHWEGMLGLAHAVRLVDARGSGHDWVQLVTGWCDEADMDTRSEGQVPGEVEPEDEPEVEAEGTVSKEHVGGDEEHARDPLYIIMAAMAPRTATTLKPVLAAPLTTTGGLQLGPVQLSVPDGWAGGTTPVGAMPPPALVLAPAGGGHSGPVQGEVPGPVAMPVELPLPPVGCGTTVCVSNVTGARDDEPGTKTPPGAVVGTPVCSPGQYVVVVTSVVTCPTGQLVTVGAQLRDRLGRDVAASRAVGHRSDTTALDEDEADVEVLLEDVVEEDVVDETVVEEALVDETVVEEAVVDETVVDEALVDETVVEEVVDEVLVEEDDVVVVVEVLLEVVDEVLVVEVDDALVVVEVVVGAGGAVLKMRMSLILKKALVSVCGLREMYALQDGWPVEALQPPQLPWTASPHRAMLMTMRWSLKMPSTSQLRLLRLTTGKPQVEVSTFWDSMLAGSLPDFHV